MLTSGENFDLSVDDPISVVSVYFLRQHAEEYNKTPRAFPGDYFDEKVLEAIINVAYISGAQAWHQNLEALRFANPKMLEDQLSTLQDICKEIREKK